MRKRIDTAKNGSGDSFVIQQHASGEWYATQTSGLDRNYLGIPALLHARSRPALIADLSAHYSN